KSYLADAFALPGQQTALDVARLGPNTKYGDLYAVVSGDYSIPDNLLRNARKPETGGFYIVENRPDNGFAVIGSLAVPSSRVAIDGTLAYLAAGEAGLVIVDISDPAHPRILSRLSNIGTVYDVAVDGHTA